MQSKPNPPDFTTSMRIPGIIGTGQFCVSANSTTAYIYDRAKDSFIVSDITHGNCSHELRRLNFRKIKDETVWCGIRYIQNSLRTILLAVVCEESTNRYFSVILDLRIKEGSAEVIEEIDLGIEKTCSNSSSYLVNDENGDLYFIVYWHKIEERQTTFHVAKLKVDQSPTINYEVLKRNQTIDNLCSNYFFISDRSITFILYDTIQSQTVTIFFDGRRSLHSGKAPGFSGGNRDKIYQSNATYTSPCFQNNTVYYYVFDCEKSTGKLWALDLISKQWRKCFELAEHAIKDHATFVVTAQGNYFLHGNCAHESCSEKAHLYHFGIYFPKKTIYPRVEQLNALLSTSKTQIYYGPKDSGKTLTLLLKAISAVHSSSDRNKIKIFASSSRMQKKFIYVFCRIFEKNFDSNNILLLAKETDIDAEEYSDCDIFVDDLPQLSFQREQLLSQRQGQSVVTVHKDNDFSYVFDQPRNEKISLYQLKLPSNKIFSNIPEKSDNSTEFLIESSTNAMNQFYGDWWDSSSSKTIFIPASHDVFSNRFLGPTECAAAGFDQEQFENKERLIRGQQAENDFMKAFQKLCVGGIFVSGFHSISFQKSLNCHTKYNKTGIDQFEVDALFVHPRMGIFVFETKATEDKGSRLQDIKIKAINQLRKIKLQLPIIFQNLVSSNCAVPIHSAVCFPNAITLADYETENGNHIFYRSYIEDEKKLKAFMLSKMTYQSKDEIVLESLKKFAAAVAGYRSLDFLSAGHNALAIHRMIEKRSGMDFQEDIFLTNEQLGVLGCAEKRQIISGPPGSGKTLVLLRKAFKATQTEKSGYIHVLTGRPELVFKFKKIFEKYMENMKRFPIVRFANHHDFLDIADDDDIFVDEQMLGFLNRDKLRQRQRPNCNSETIIVITGLVNPVEIINVDQWLEDNELLGYYHFHMNTVIRSSKHIFAEWQKEYPRINYSLHIGHNIDGQSVQWSKGENSKEIFHCILKIIQELFLTDKNSEDSTKLSLEFLCIISDDVETCSLIKNFLSEHSIPCGSIEEQIKKRNMNDEWPIVAVSGYAGTISHEWPIVIAVSVNEIYYPSNFFFIAASRCITKLIVIERDLNATKKIDQKTMSLFNEGSFENLHDVVNSAERENGETKELIIYIQALFQAIRRNIFSSELKKMKAFENCESLLRGWQRIAERPALCRVLFENREGIRIFGDIESFFIQSLTDLCIDSVSVSDQPSKLFTRLTSDYSEEEVKKYWCTFKRVIESSMNALAKEPKGHQSDATEIEEMKQFSEELRNLNNYEWKFLQETLFCLLF